MAQIHAATWQHEATFHGAETGFHLLNFRTHVLLPKVSRFGAGGLALDSVFMLGGYLITLYGVTRHIMPGLQRQEIYHEHRTHHWGKTQPAHACDGKPCTATAHMIRGRITQSSTCAVAVSQTVRKAWQCRRCRTTCTDRGGTPGGGQSYGSFTCALPVKPKMVCLHVAPSGKSYKIATGTLPDSPEGASGIGTLLSISENNFLNHAMHRELSSFNSQNAWQEVCGVFHQHDPKSKHEQVKARHKHVHLGHRSTVLCVSNSVFRLRKACMRQPHLLNFLLPCRRTVSSSLCTI